MPQIEDYLGVFQQFEVVQNAYSPESRRIAYDQDGTVIINDFGSARKVFNVGELSSLNSEHSAGIAGADAGFIYQWGTGYIYIIFKEMKSINGLWMCLSASATDKPSESEGYVDYGYLHQPGVALPSAEFSTDAKYEGGVLTGTWSSVPSDFNKNIFRGEKVGKANSNDMLYLTDPVPSYMVDVKISNPLQCLALKIPYRTESDQITFKSLHLYGTNWVNSDKRVLAFTNAAGTEFTKDSCFGMIPRESEKTWGENNLNQSSECYVKNITQFKTLVGVTVAVDDTDSSGMTNHLDVSLDGEDWETFVDLGDIEPGQVVGPIYVRYAPDSSSGLTLRTSRLRAKVDEVR